MDFNYKNHKVNYEKDIIPYIKKGIIVSFSEEELNKIDAFAKEKTRYKATEEFYKNESFMYQCNYNGQLGELAVEKIIKIPFVDWTIGPLNNYIVCDIPKLGLGIKTCKINHLPLVPIHNKYPQIICIILPDHKVSVLGVAETNILNQYQTEDTLSDVVKKQKRKRAFYGFDKIIPLKDYFTLIQKKIAMNDIIKNQLNNIKKENFIVDGLESKYIPEDFDEIVFLKQNKQREIKVIFEDYFIKATPNFNFNEKFNNGVFPFYKIMHGEIIDETEKMYKFRLHGETNDNVWAGWCPKKCCAVIK